MDVFICHTSDDKEAIVRPLVASLPADIECWIDEGEILWGDSITAKVNDGLQRSRYVLVVLSLAFIGRKWPERELHAALNIEASSGATKLLPLLVGPASDLSKILQHYPLLNDKAYMVWPRDRARLATELTRLLNRRHDHPVTSLTNSAPTANTVDFEENSYLELDRTRYVGRWKGHRLALTEREFLILSHLVDNIGRTQSSNDLMRAANVHVDHATLASIVRSIRTSFQEFDSEFNRLKTVRSKGYLWQG